jgi:hypothetical protein
LQIETSDDGGGTASRRKDYSINDRPIERAKTGGLVSAIHRKARWR